MVQKRGVVAAGALTFLVVTDGTALGVPAGGWHGAVEVQGDTGQSQAGQALEGDVHEQAAEVVDALFIGVLQHPAQGGHVGQAIEAEDRLDQRVVAVGPAVPQFAEAEQEMDDELEEDPGRAEDLAAGHMAEARPQPSRQIQDGEELLEDHESGEGRERRVLELQGRDGMGLTTDLGSAKLHGADLLVMCLCSQYFYTYDRKRFALFMKFCACL